MAFKFGMTVDLCTAYTYPHAHFDDLDLDARSQWLGKWKHFASDVEASGQLSKH